MIFRTSKACAEDFRVSFGSEFSLLNEELFHGFRPGFSVKLIGVFLCTFHHDCPCSDSQKMRNRDQELGAA